MELIRLTAEQRSVLVRTYLEASDAVTQRRAQYLLLFDDGHSFEYVVAATYSEASEVVQTIQSFRERGLASITG